jgi:hypothetical protein
LTAESLNSRENRRLGIFAPLDSHYAVLLERPPNVGKSMSPFFFPPLFSSLFSSPL